MKVHVCRVLIVLLLSVLVVGLLYYLFMNKGKLHEEIHLSDVDAVIIWNSEGRRLASSEEEQDIIRWFNSMTNIRHNKDYAGTTPEAGIIIELKTGRGIQILASGTDFEVQRTNSSGKHVSYWGQQSDIKDILYHQN